MTQFRDELGKPSLTTQDSRFGALTIALVYSDPKAASIVKGVLDSLGCRTVSLVRDGSELLARTVTEPIDLAVIDWRFRTCSGPDIIRRLRFHVSHPRRDLPVIQICPDHSETHRRTALDAGANDVVSSPFSARAILGTVYGVIERPLPFIISPGYVGPDRRSAESAPSRPTVNKDLRKTQPLKIATLTEVISYGLGTVAVVDTDYSLKMKLGLAVPDRLVVPEALLQNAEATLVSARFEFAREVEHQINELLALNRLLIQRPDRAHISVQAIRQVAYWIESRSRELGHMRISDIAKLLIEFCDRHFMPDHPNNMILLEKHVLTLIAILRAGPEAARGVVGESLVRDLARQVASFKKQ